MTDFKVGDKVRVVNPPAWLQSTTDIGKIVDPLDDLCTAIVEIDCQGHMGHYDFTKDNLELIVESPFKPGDHIEYKVRGVVKNVWPTGVLEIDWEDNSNDKSFAVDRFEYLTKIAPPFPTRTGSLIKAKCDGAEKLLFKTPFAAEWAEPDGTTWPTHHLELISVEYEPGDE